MRRQRISLPEPVSDADGFLRTTLLAPDIIEAIIDGTEPDGLSLEKLYRLPPAWENQRRLLDGVSADSSDGGQ